MSLCDFTNLTASLTLSGNRYGLIPGETTALPGGISATVAIPESAESWQYRVLSVSHGGATESGQITVPAILDAVIPTSAPVKLHTIRGDDCSKNSFLPIDATLHPGDSMRFAPSGGRPSNTTAFPILDLTIEDYALLLAIGWDGQWLCHLTMTESGLHILITMEHADFYMRPGESYTLPSLLLLTAADAAQARRDFRHLLTTTFSPLPKVGYDSDHLPVSIQPFDRYFYGRCPLWPTEEGQLLTLEKARLCEGFDHQWLDAAWFRDGFPTGVGNYEFEKGYPRGLKPVTDAVHEAGMRFVLWFEPERIARGSDVWRNLPDFYLHRTDDPDSEDNFLYNLGNDDAWQWLYSTLVNFIRDNGIDNYRQDFNIDPLGFWLYNDQPNRRGITEIQYVNGFYRLWDALRAEFPHLFIDDCASGGRRIEFETLRRSVPMWRSDITCGPITDVAHNDVYNQNETLTLGEYLPYHACAVWEPNANDFRSAATAGLACTFDILNPNFDFGTAKKLLAELHRTAPLWTGDFYPLTEPSLEEDCFTAYQLNQKNQGCAYIFRCALCSAETFLLSLRGLDSTAVYHVTVTDECLVSTTKEYTGAVLAAGIPVTLPQAHSTALVEYTIC